MATDGPGIKILLAWLLATAGCGPDEVEVPSPCPEPVVDVELGTYTTCALTESGRLRCFGLFDWLTAWLESSDPPWALPWVEFPSPPVAMFGLGRVCVLLSDGRRSCADSQDGFVDPPVVLDLGAMPIATTGHRVLLEDGRLLELGDGAWAEVETPGPVAQFDQGLVHTCLVTRDGNIACAGANDFGGAGELSGQLGVPGIESSVAFLQLPLSGAVGVALGEYHSCAWFETGEYACWGDGSGGKLGDGTSGNRIGDDETLDDLPRYALDGAVVQMAANRRATCARLDDGGVRCWGDGVFVQLDRYKPSLDLTTTVADPLSEPRIPLPEPAIDLDLGESHACAVGESGAVYCWGYAPSEYRETNNWSVLDDGGYLDPSTGLVRPLVLEDPETCTGR